MKKIVLFLFLCFCVSPSLSKDDIIITKDSSTSKYTAKEVVEVPGKDKDEIFNILHDWVVINYVSANDVIHQIDKERGRIVVKGIYPEVAWGVSTADIKHSLILEVKDEKCRITITNFEFFIVIVEKSFQLEEKKMPSQKTGVKRANSMAVEIINRIKSALENSDDW